MTRIWTRRALLALSVLAVILVPFALFAEPLEQWAHGFTANPGPFAAPILACLLAADVFLPIPSSLVSAACGAVYGPVWGTLISSSGMIAGSALGYLAGRGMLPLVERRILGKDEVTKIDGTWRRFGPLSLVLLRGVPVLAEASILYAGMAAMPFGRFLLWTSAANLLVSAAYAWLGAGAVHVTLGRP